MPTSSVLDQPVPVVRLSFVTGHSQSLDFIGKSVEANVSKEAAVAHCKGGEEGEGAVGLGVAKACRQACSKTDVSGVQAVEGEGKVGCNSKYVTDRRSDSGTTEGSGETTGRGDEEDVLRETGDEEAMSGLLVLGGEVVSVRQRLVPTLTSTVTAIPYWFH